MSVLSRQKVIHVRDGSHVRRKNGKTNFQIEENSYEDDSCEENEELEDDFLSF